jgi:hypothetical protein
MKKKIMTKTPDVRVTSLVKMSLKRNKSKKMKRPHKKYCKTNLLEIKKL